MRPRSAVVGQIDYLPLSWQNESTPVEPNGRAATGNRCTKGRTGPGLNSIGSGQLRKPLLYPLSYEATAQRLSLCKGRPPSPGACDLDGSLHDR
jgi:hypothetical protein